MKVDCYALAIDALYSQSGPCPVCLGALMGMVHQSVPAKYPLDILPYRSGYLMSARKLEQARFSAAIENTFRVIQYKAELMYRSAIDKATE